MLLFHGNKKVSCMAQEIYDVLICFALDGGNILWAATTISFIQCPNYD